MWYRSWPTDDELRTRQCQRSRVVDRLPRLHMANFDYRTVETWPSGHGFCMLEWDVALDQQSRIRFARIAKAEPCRVLVAPYQYGSAAQLPAVSDGRPDAAAFGFGCIYFPSPVLRAALDHCHEVGVRLTDETFSAWYTPLHGPARVTWDVHPQHLHDF